MFLEIRDEGYRHRSQFDIDLLVGGIVDDVLSKADEDLQDMGDFLNSQVVAFFETYSPFVDDISFNVKTVTLTVGSRINIACSTHLSIRRGDQTIGVHISFLDCTSQRWETLQLLLQQANFAGRTHCWSIHEKGSPKRPEAALDEDQIVELAHHVQISKQIASQAGAVA